LSQQTSDIGCDYKHDQHCGHCPSLVVVVVVVVTAAAAPETEAEEDGRKRRNVSSSSARTLFYLASQITLHSDHFTVVITT